MARNFHTEGADESWRIGNEQFRPAYRTSDRVSKHDVVTEG
jgi:hypothetical protein